ncbi:hypothetical protein ENBRE01_1446 [Enteropsectra breve]|nr:hypothetical protein ENBRE01_1446 [Enteropsectra breve]
MDTKMEDIILFKTKSKEEIIEYFRSLNLLKSHQNCDKCERPMIMRKRAAIKDGFQWVCRNAACSSYKTTMSIRTGSFFEQFNISLVDVYLIVFGRVTDKQN